MGMRGEIMRSSGMQTTHKNRIRKTIVVSGSFLAMLLGLACPLFQWPVSAQDPMDAFGGPPHSIAFHSNRDGNNEVYVMNPDGPDQTRLTFESRNDQRPDVSPNGKQIVFVSNRITQTNPTGDFEIFVMSSVGSDVTQLTF